MQKPVKADSACGRATEDDAGVIRPAEVLLAETARLRKVIAGMGLCGADAEDVLQIVSVRCLSGPGRFADRQQCLRWLMQVIANECITEHRRRGRFRRQAAAMVRRSPQSPVDCPMGIAVTSERIEAVQEALRDLDEAILKPLVLKYFCDLSSAEIGEILGMPASTVRSTLRQARMELARGLMNRGVEQ